MTINVASVYHVVDSEAVKTLGADIATVGKNMFQAMTDTRDAWSKLHQYFEVSGAEGAYSMMEGPLEDTQDFMGATNNLQRICNTYSSKFETLATRRKNLITEITELNKELSSLNATLENDHFGGNICYDVSTEDGLQKDLQLSTLRMDMIAAQSEEERLREQVSSFNEAVIAAEQKFASKLTGVDEGLTVRGTDGQDRGTRKTFWGKPGSDMSDTPLVNRFERKLTNAIEQQLDEVAQWGAQRLESWASENPEFIAAVGLADPEQLQRWYEGISDNSEITTLFLAAAPGIIGNMNGIPSEVKDTHNRKYLDQLLADDSLSKKDRERLENVRTAVTDIYGNPLGNSALLSLFLDTSDKNEPRADVAYGNVDNADLVTTLSHGISNDLQDLPEWASTAQHLQGDQSIEAARRGYTPAEGRTDTAVVVTFGYDSKGKLAVQGTAHADAGAMRYSRLMEGIETVNPEAKKTGWFHSYGTTKGAEAVARNPDLLDQMYTVGSAGWTETAADAIGKSDTDVYSTAASQDWTAWGGRTSAISDHPVNPVDLDYTTTISSEGGTVDFGIGEDGTVRVEEGKQTQGHASHHHNPWYEGWRSQQGYLQPDSQAYLEGVNFSVDLLTKEQK